MRTVTVVGRIGKDAELTYTPQGIAVAKFSIAVDNGKDKEGEKRKATWFNCAIWRDRAEKLSPYIKKGNVAAVSGDVDARCWINKNNGEAQCSLEVNVDKFTFGGSSERSEQPAPATPPARQDAAAQAIGSSTITVEDFPF